MATANANPVYPTVVVGDTSTEILPDRTADRGRISARVYNEGPLPFFPRFGEDAVLDESPPVPVGAYANINPRTAGDDWLHMAYNGIVSGGGTTTLRIEEAVRIP